MTNQAERRHHQPLLIVAEESCAYEDGTWTYAISLRNEGAGTAFTTTFGIEVGGQSYVYAAKPSGPGGTGDVPRALPADGTRYHYRLAGLPAFDGANPHADRSYWTRCENTLGEVWCTSNPLSADPTAFKIHRERAWRRWLRGEPKPTPLMTPS